MGRELVNGSFDLYTSRVAEGTNETMRLLTAATVVLGTVAAVAGILGMNFDAELLRSGDLGFWATVAGLGLFSLFASLIAWRWRVRSRA